MPNQKLKDFLDQHRISYSSIPHPLAYTAERVAAASGISGYNFAKTVMVKIDGELAMVVLPAQDRIDFDQIRRLTKASEIEMASEEDFKDAFPDCEIGAMPPFGNLYDIPVFVSDKLSKSDRIAFNAGTHTEALLMSYQAYEGLISPQAIKYNPSRV